jgi:transcription initiation factor IIE alpha subunit
MGQAKGKSVMNNKVIIAHQAKATSRDAANRVYPRSGSIRLEVYEFLIRRGLDGATDQEIESNLNLDGNTVRPTRKTLEQDELIVDSGTTRSNHNGNQCIVWRAISADQMF